ncbi:hypothetical protein PBI_GAIA_61 [Mycobacterium phage Gaia]|uniref:Uncharacterized protein n=1 Tax=Mycobacterium phage Gaia TaxID=1486472 RepID=A0A068F8P5_9CAUD|nr:hypothetical protein VC46_gp172 [Mycobacterium phage Gaia]AID58880.1 hypothetical protein PBI_GAIA_61 [Mycobacterium phage Gaia]AYR00002.1 hypothetical protein PBI_NEBKISS_62 [Mycobacterium phage Nebkiss]
MGEIKLGPRRWIAWKLVQLAYRIYDAERYERIYVNDPDGNLVFEAVVIGDLYGCGISSIFRDGAELPARSVIHWDEDYRPDWLEGDLEA